MKIFLLPILCFLTFSLSSFATLPVSPTDVNHPGSKIYSYGVKEELINCGGRDVSIFSPISNITLESVSVIIYGHGQALKLEHYRGTLEHLAKKGILAVFPIYDSGFFDRDWRRMARDYINLSACALNTFSKSSNVKINSENIIFSGHSKGAYVAGVASGLAFKEKLALKPKAVMLFEPAGLDEEANSAVDKEVIYNVVYSDKDKVVDRKIAEGIFQQVPSSKKQFIFVRSYPELDAGHFWPLTKSSAFGGQNENAYHYYSSWKWLVAQANDLKIGGLGSDHFLFGAEALNKGVDGIQDEITRSW